jgi:LytS/YehU family sensor histidine kinase
MNPHFIFNSLNSISNFIIKNKTTIAQAYLAKFARLMRLILDNSREKMIPLEDEVETLQLYMEQERLRFNEIFDFKIKVDDSIDQEFTYVPPMLVQPFVENAILHGLAPKGEQGDITVSFRMTESLIEVVVLDNGIGRNAALKRKEQRDNKRKSLGMQVTQERLDIFREESGMEVAMQIVDLLDGEKALGTKVILRIPFEEE